MKLINHPSVIQDIIDLALMLPPEDKRNPPPCRGPVHRFLDEVARAAREIKQAQAADTKKHNEAVFHRKSAEMMFDK